MTYGYENLKLEKGMYAQSGKSFSRVLESLDPSENYRGTALEGLDAFQRQLKRFDIHVKGAGSDMVEKFFHTTDSAVLFPEFVSRVVRQGMESDILPEITATTTNFDGMDYRTIASVPTDDDKALRRVEEGAVLPTTAIRTQENLVKLHKRGRMLVASYEAIRFQRLDLFSVTLRQIGAHINRMHLEDAIDVLLNAAGGNMPGATIAPDKTVLDLDVDAFRKVVDLNLFGTVLPTMVFVDVMAKNKKGAIVNFCSESALRPLTRVVGYGSAKAAIGNYTRYMATELATKFSPELRVNAIVPGFLLTNQNRALLTNPDGSYTDRAKTIIAHTPCGRFAEPEELFGTIHYLISDASSFVTGALSVVDGGFDAFSI